MTIAANTSTYVDVPFTVPSGYTALLAVSVDSGAANCFIRSASYITGNYVRCYIDNIGSTSRTPTVRVAVLFYKGA